VQRSLMPGLRKFSIWREERKAGWHFVFFLIALHGRSFVDSLRINLIALLTGLILVLGGADHALAQACASIATANSTGWTITGGSDTLTLTLQQTNNPPNSSVTGTLTGSNAGCPAGLTYPTTGVMISTTGQLNLTSTYTGTLPSTCANRIVWQGTVQAPGCSTVSAGTYTNTNFSTNETSNGTFTMSEACVVPSGETTPVVAGFTTNADVVEGTFNQQPSPPSGSSYFNWGGRTVTETFSTLYTAIDSCYALFPDSIYPAVTQATAMVANPFIISSNSGYGDNVGDPTVVFDYYRQNGVLPCGWTLYQTMVIDCPGGNRPYSTEALSFLIGDSTITVTRSGVPQTETYGPFPTKEIMNILTKFLLLQ
jgi:hypothetical protein